MPWGTGAIDGAARTSPWPVLVAVGIAVSELAVFVGSVPFAVAGLILAGGAVAGLAHDAGYGASPVGPLLVSGSFLVVVGGGIWLVRAPPPLLALPGEPVADGVARRGVAILAAGAVLVATGVVGWVRSALGR